MLPFLESKLNTVSVVYTAVLMLWLRLMSFIFSRYSLGRFMDLFIVNCIFASRAVCFKSVKIYIRVERRNYDSQP